MNHHPTIRVGSLVFVCLLSSTLAWAQGHPGLRTIAPIDDLRDLQRWDRRVDDLRADGSLRARSSWTDVDVAGRTHERLAQYHDGIPVVGADVTRQFANGLTISVFGRIYEGIDIAVAPSLSTERIETLIAQRTGVALGPTRRPALVVLPVPTGGYRLAYQARIVTAGSLTSYFFDAYTGEILKARSDLQSQAAVGTAVGVLGDRKKISVESLGGRFVASDLLRPPSIATFDMQADLDRTVDFLNGLVPLGPSDLASDTDNDWDQGQAVDAHVYAGLTYDYFFKRFGRRGLDDGDLTMRSLVNPVRREDIFSQTDDVVGNFYLNAFYAGQGVMVYGVGLPRGLTLGGQVWDFLSGALDVVAHELTHGVTDFTSALIYENESGALNESFSDMMAIAVEFFFQDPGNAPGRADYRLGEDVIRPNGIRSIENPLAYGDPDHYSRRVTGEEDNGGVHTNSGIPNQAYYLAIEGGANRTSGLAVQGVGAANRAQIEHVFYRAFTRMLPADATFSVARAATVQAARDLYGAGSPAERAILQAWTAVGVN